MQIKTSLVNTNEAWSAKRRYKINSVVNLSGNTYQNSTGINSNPNLGIDWISLKASSEVPVVYHQDFIADVTKQFTVPLDVYIKNVFIGNISANGADWSQTGQIVTVTSSQVGDLVTLTN